MHPQYTLTLHKTYYEKGFFNLGIAVDKYVRPQSGAIAIMLDGRRELNARVDREANLNGTPRIHGGQELRDWFFKHYKLRDKIIVTILSPTVIRLG